MSTRRFYLLVIVAILGLCAACGGRRPEYDRELEVYGPFLAQGGICYLNSTLNELIRLTPSYGGPELERAYLSPAPRKQAEVLEGSLLAVLHQDPEAPGVTLLHTDTLREAAWLPLGEQFDQMEVSPTTRFGLAYFSPNAGSSGVIRNLNQVQVLDFQSSETQPPLALETGGLSPRGVTFLPAGSGDFDDIAVVLVDNGLVILDMRDPGVQPLWVRFTNAPGGLAVPAEVVFGRFTNADGGYIYVRLQGSDDVLSVHLIREGGQLYRTINFLNTPAGSRPSDLLVLQGNDFSDKVFVVYSTAQGSAAILDANAIQTDEQVFSFDIPVLYAERLLGADGRELVAVYHPNSSSARLFVVDPLSSEVETVQFQDRFDRIAIPEQGSHLVVFHPTLTQTATPGMRVVRMEPHSTSGRLTHRIATYSLDAKLDSFTFADDRRTMLAALHMSPSTFQLDLETGGYGALELDKRPVSAGLVPFSGWSYFQHQHPLGSLTLVPLNKFEREHAVMIEGFILMDLLDPR